MADLINSEVGVELENRLREKRQALALSQKKLADLAGITRQAISALESDQYSPRHFRCAATGASAPLPSRGSVQSQARRTNHRGRTPGFTSQNQPAGACSGHSDRPPIACASTRWSRGISEPECYSGRYYRGVAARQSSREGQTAQRPRSRAP